MSDVAIRVENLSKLYHIGGPQARYKTIRESIQDGLKAPFRRAAKVLTGQAHGAAELDQTIWALKDVSFEVKQGEVVGIIGRNGAGKSTLLKILSRITEPTVGEVMLRGRVGSLLEVGTGFHPELTGRENIYLNGSILGMRRFETEQKFDEIVEFAEIEKFIDTPVKHYSSGMYVRLAFSVAAHLEPEVLLVDEVLAVGDASFQKKCLGKMGEVALQGRTVLFVSHNLGSIQKLCNRGLLLSDGSLDIEGEASEIIKQYIDNNLVNLPDEGEIFWEKSEQSANNSIILLRTKISTNDGDPKKDFLITDQAILEIEYYLKVHSPGMRIVVQVIARNGEVVFTNTDHDLRKIEHSEVGRYVTKVYLPSNILNLGTYFIKIWAGIPGVRYLLSPIEIHKFTIKGNSNHGSYIAAHKTVPGLISPKLDWVTKLLA